jgi:thymidylate synthase
MHVRNFVEDIRREFLDLLEVEDFVTDKTGVKMLEIVGASFVADEPSIFGKVNEDYVQRELEWYKSMSLSVNDIPGGPPAIWKQVCDNNGYINSNYGWCIWSGANCWQYENVLGELRKNPESRRATMIYTRPNMWYDYNHNGRSDFMCTNAVQYLIRKSRLDCVVQMRSNDVVFGYKNDYAWQKHVLDQLSTEVGVPPGDIHWNVGSLHVYERHFDLIQS